MARMIYNNKFDTATIHMIFFLPDALESPVEQDSANSHGMPKEEQQYDKGVLTDHLHNYNTDIEAQSSFFSYFVLMALVCIIMYLMFHNKQKVSRPFVAFT